MIIETIIYNKAIMLDAIAIILEVCAFFRAFSAIEFAYFDISFASICNFSAVTRFIIIKMYIFAQ